jgi:hypothetical protein
VTLSSIEDDGLGEELQVVWELEPGARIYEALHTEGQPLFEVERLISREHQYIW